MEAQEIYLSDIVCAACICLTLQSEGAALELSEDYCLAYYRYDLAVLSLHIIESVRVEETEVVGIYDTGFILKVVGKMISYVDHLIIFAQERDVHAGVQ